MIRRISLATISLCIAACASSGPETPAPAVTDPSAGAAGAVIHDPDAPTVYVTKNAMAESDPDEIICQREREPGSNFSRKICRTRAEIDARAARDQEALRISRSGTVELEPD